MTAGVIILVTLSLTSGLFGAVGFPIILLGACLLKRREAEANRYYAHKLTERDTQSAWHRSMTLTAHHHSGTPLTLGKPDPAPSATVRAQRHSPRMSSPQDRHTAANTDYQRTNAGPTSHSDAA